jgi:hypothetical protein
MKGGKGQKPPRVPPSKLRIYRKELKLEELKAILIRAKEAPLSPEEYKKLDVAIDTLAFLTNELEAKGASIRRLRQMLFGASTEKTSQVVGEEASSAPAVTSPTPSAAEDEGHGAVEDEGHGAAEGDATDESSDPPRPKRKGHGRRSAAEYTGAEKNKVPHESLKPGDDCPECLQGKLYLQAEPAVLVRVNGVAPLSAVIHELERLRCNLCGEVFTARAPEGVGKKKYDETAAAMIAMLKYGCGFPFNRLERLEGSLGIPLPSGTQWEVVEGEAGLLAPVYQELINQAAQGEVLHNDDTTMKILGLDSPSAKQQSGDEADKKRTGTFTTGIVSVGEDHRIALFFTGRQHAGENLADVLAKRAAELPLPIQMCDALKVNTTGDFETILANCLAHGRRKFVEVATDFPEEVRHVLETLRDVYHNDDLTKKQGMTPEDRLIFHQQKSGPLMAKLEIWLRAQIDEKKVEPNSGCGRAIKYMQRHWEKLTLFLKVAGAPLDNNICERALKKAILHRKNAMFYKTENGAHVGDLFMSLIYTCELNGVNPFDYLVELQRHPKEVAATSADWMPWNYRETLARLGAGGESPDQPN